MARKIFIALLLMLTLIWTAFIFANSLDTAKESSKKSSSVTEVVNKVASSVGIKDEIPHRTVRDMAHFTEFLVLSCLVCSDLLLILYKKLRPLLWHILCPVSAVGLCFLLACVDELLQKTSSGRASQFSDIMLDTLGAACGALALCATLALVNIVVLYIKRKKE